MNEIRAALAGSNFVVIWRRRDPTADDLAGYMTAHAAVGQGVHYLGDAGGKLPQPIGKFFGHHAEVVHMTNDQFSMTNSQLFQTLDLRQGLEQPKKAARPLGLAQQT